jgi:predicted ATPase
MGLHPDMINGVARGIKYAAQNGTQMIIATHSPLLLNAFELEDLMIFEKNERNESIVKKYHLMIQQLDPEKLKYQFEDFHNLLNKIKALLIHA